MRISFSLLLTAMSGIAAAAIGNHTQPFLLQTSNSSWIIGNGLWNITLGPTYGTKLYFQNRDLVGSAEGHYSGYDGENNFVYTSARVVSQSGGYTDIALVSPEVELHWVLTATLPGAYQYIVNRALPTVSVLRTLLRLDNGTFTHGHTNIKDAALPPLADIRAGTKVQDETWRRANGSGYITKYDWSDFVRGLGWYGVYGPEAGLGSWYLRPGGREWLNGDALKQELTVHRESSSGDAVQLNVVHGSHFMAEADDSFETGRVWGPWLWYLNDGNQTDVAQRFGAEEQAWPYAWFNNSAYQARGNLSGQLRLSDARPGAGAAVFLGENETNRSTLDQGVGYHYVATADAEGRFNFTGVRAGTYALSAWADGGAIGDVSTVFQRAGVVVQQGEATALGTLDWATQGRTALFRIGDFDRKALGFRYGGAPYQHALVDRSPANLTFTVGQSATEEWYFAQNALGRWTVRFAVAELRNASAVLTLSLAGYSKGVSEVVLLNGQQVGNLTSGDIPSDPSVYRSGTTAGEWHRYGFEIANDLLKQGWNDLVFEVTRTTQWHGIMWDAIALEWEK